MTALWASPELLEVLADVCGYHTGPGCEHCTEGLARRRAEGMTDDEILADATLFRDDFNAWYASKVAAMEKG